MGLFKNVGKKIKGGWQDAGNFLKDKAQDLGSAAKDAIDKVKDAGKFALLLPVRKILENVLKSKGITPSKDIETLALQFHNEVVRKGDFDEAILTSDGSNIFVAAEPTQRKNVKDLDPVTIGAIVSGIISWIQKSREKKAEGKELTKAQKVAVDTADTIEKETGTLIDEQVTFEIGAFMRKYGLVIVGAIVVLFLFLGKKR